MKNTKLILSIIAIIAIAVLLILNKFLVYGLVLSGFAFVIYFLGNLFIKNKEEQIAALEKTINDNKSRIQELEQKKMNISQITAILEFGLFEIDTVFHRIFNRSIDDGRLKFQGTLKIDIKAKYGIDLKELRFKPEGNTILVYNLNPKFLSFSKRECSWSFAETLEFVKPVIGENNWRIRDRNDIVTLMECETLRNQVEAEFENGIEELKWIEKPLQNQALNVLKTFVFPKKEICTFPKTNKDLRLKIRRGFLACRCPQVIWANASKISTICCI